MLGRRQAFSTAGQESIRTREAKMIFVGNDWAEGHHDVYLMDEGRDPAGFRPSPGRPRGCSPVPPDGRRARIGGS